VGRFVDRELAAVIANTAYERAATALAAGFEQCDEYRALTELQKAAMLKATLAHFQGLDREIELVLGAAETIGAEPHTALRPV
jgi:hypothetical protein